MKHENSVSKDLEDRLKDPHFAKLYDLEFQKLEIVKHIVDYRVKHNLGQGNLAKKVGVSQQHISKIENGEFSNVTTLSKVLLAIGYAVRLQVIPLGRRPAHRTSQGVFSKKRLKQLKKAA